MQKLEKPSLEVASTTSVQSNSLEVANSSTASDCNVHPNLSLTLAVNFDLMTVTYELHLEWVGTN